MTAGSPASEPTRIEFTTGNTVLGMTVPAVPTVSAAIGTRTGSTTSCGDHSVTCVSSREGGTLEFGTRDASGAFIGTLLFTLNSAAENGGVWRGEGPPASYCFAVRARDLAGRRSAAVDVCSDAIDHVSVPGDGFASITCAGGHVLVNSQPAMPDVRGCSVARGKMRSAPVWMVGHGLVVMLTRRRRSSGRASG